MIQYSGEGYNSPRVRAPDQSILDEPLDSSAEKEEEALRKDISLETAEKHHAREQRKLALISLGMLSILAVIILIILASMIIAAIHYLAPEEFHWLSDNQLETLKTFILSAAMTSVASSLINKYL